jgi:ABC-type multidrug transport system fused ATPase/permease subunit
MLAFVRHHRVSILWLTVMLVALLFVRLLNVAGYNTNSLVSLVLFFTVLFYFIRGMDALQRIASRLERIEHLLTNWPPTAEDPSASTTAT